MGLAKPQIYSSHERKGRGDGRYFFVKNVVTRFSDPDLYGKQDPDLHHVLKEPDPDPDHYFKRAGFESASK
jgi:hypothetical protein